MFFSLEVHSEQGSFDDAAFDDAAVEEYLAAVNEIIEQSPEHILIRNNYETALYEHKKAINDHERAWSDLARLLPEPQRIWEEYEKARAESKPSSQLDPLKEKYETSRKEVIALVSSLTSLRENIQKTRHERNIAGNEYDRIVNTLTEQHPELKRLREKIM